MKLKCYISFTVKMYRIPYVNKIYIAFWKLKSFLKTYKILYSIIYELTITGENNCSLTLNDCLNLIWLKLKFDNDWCHFLYPVPLPPEPESPKKGGESTTTRKLFFYLKCCIKNILSNMKKTGTSISHLNIFLGERTCPWLELSRIIASAP